MIYDNNMDDVAHYKEFLQNYPVDYLYFKPGIMKNLTPEKKARHKEVLHMLHSLVGDMEQDIQIEVADDKIDNVINDKAKQSIEKCYMGSIFPLLGADGKLYFCCHSLDKPELCLGDLTRERLSDIYSRFVLSDYGDFHTCQINCRGHLINQDVEYMLSLLANEHRNFL